MKEAEEIEEESADGKKTKYRKLSVKELENVEYLDVIKYLNNDECVKKYVISSN
jgi:hypothetical protein